MPGSDKKYIPKTVAPTEKEVCSIGGFRTIPDYSFRNLPEDYAALILIGGMQWNTPVAESLVPIVTKALQQGKIVGAICNAASFMAAHGFLNHVKHTGNTKEQLKLWGKENYTNENGYMEFCRDILLLLQADTDENIMNSYKFHKYGLYNE